MKTINSLVIIGRKWFDKPNGNTYHTAEIIIDGFEAYKSEMQYGYGEAYLQTASEWLKDYGYIDKPEYQSLTAYFRDNNIPLVYREFWVKKSEL